MEEVRETKRYLCGYCGREFADRADAYQCSQRHSTPRAIISWSFGMARELNIKTYYPRTINVQMQNGLSVTYVRADAAHGDGKEEEK